MPGFAGILSLKRKDSTQITADINKMVKSLCHFDDYIIDNYVFKNNSIVFSNVSLNIPKFPVQKYCCKNRKIHTILEGEILNIRELGDYFLPSEIIENNSAKLIALLYLQFSDFQFMDKLNGWFNLIIYDGQKDLFVIANDRYGFRPLYFKHTKDSLIFSSEVKSILQALSGTKELDYESISNYFTFRAILNEKTFFKDIFRFPPASIWIIQNRSLKKRTYWHISEYFNLEKYSENEVLDISNKLFRKIIGRYLKDNYLVSISGGWDTRTMMSLLDYGQRPDSCFTYGLNKISAENILAQKIAKILYLPHRFILIDDNFFKDFPHYAEKAIWISDGMGDITASSVLFVHNEHRNNICVGGKYGNQVDLSDHPKKKYSLKKIANLEILSKDFYNEVKKYPYQSIKKAYKKLEGFKYHVDKCMFFSIYELCRRYWGDRLALENSMLLFRSPYTDNDLIEFMLRLPQNMRRLRAIQGHIISKNNIKLAKIPTNTGGLPLSGNLLKMIWAATFRGWDYSTKICNYKKTPPILRTDLTFLANNTTTKYPTWFRGQLKNYVYDMILDKKTLSREFFDSNTLKKIVNDHINRKKDYTDYIKKIISFELFLRQFVDSN